MEMNDDWLNQFGKVKKRTPLGIIRACKICTKDFDPYTSRQRRCHDCFKKGALEPIEVRIKTGTYKYNAKKRQIKEI